MKNEKLQTVARFVMIVATIVMYSGIAVAILAIFLP